MSLVISTRREHCVLAYIKLTLRKELICRHHNHLRIEAYSDVGYLGDKGDRKLTTNYYMYVGDNIIIWCFQSKRWYLVKCKSQISCYG